MQDNQEILHVYEEESGQKINKEKTMFFFYQEDNDCTKGSCEGHFKCSSDDTIN